MNKNQTISHYQGESGSIYDRKRAIIEKGAVVQAEYFQKHIKENYKVLDFGCGRGTMLMNIRCKLKHGIEINEHSRKLAEKNIDNVYETVDELDDNYYDVIISNHALEHTICPFTVIKNLREKLRNGGKIVFIVPLDDWRYNEQKKYESKDIDQHLYTWTPLSLGNLFSLANFSHISIEIITKAWSPKFLFLRNNKIIFNIIQILFAIYKKRRQILIHAEK